MCEQAVLNIANRAKPEIIGICSTGVTETKGDDVDGFIKLIRAKHPELRSTSPWFMFRRRTSRAPFRTDGRGPSTQMVETHGRAVATRVRRSRKINVLPGCHLTPGDIDELRDMIERSVLQRAVSAGPVRVARRPYSR